MIHEQCKSNIFAGYLSPVRHLRIKDPRDPRELINHDATLKGEINTPLVVV